jgi:uncharacterized protein
MKHSHEFRDPIHTFITVRSDERKVIDSRPFQRLRQIHQLALTYLVYPGATHRRFEHSLGVMELTTRIFDVVTHHQNVRDNVVKDILPDEDAIRYWRATIRMAALCHDIGHLPFSHAAEAELLPPEWDHERLTKELIRSPEMCEIWAGMTPPLRPDDIVRLAVGPKKTPELEFKTWHSILAEIVVGDAFGADRIDYLLRDSYHAGVQYGRFDHNRLINTLRILPRSYQQTDEPALGLEDGGLESSEALMLARYFIYKQVYLHPVRRIYDRHLVDFLKLWLEGGNFPTDVERHLDMSDAEVLAAIGVCSKDRLHPAHEASLRLKNRDHFKLFYTVASEDKSGGILQPGKALFDLACKRFSPDQLRYDYLKPKSASPDFPVLRYDNIIESSLKISPVLDKIPSNEIDAIYCDRRIFDDAIKWKAENRIEAFRLSTQESLKLGRA